MRHKEPGDRLIAKDKKTGTELWNFEAKKGVEVMKSTFLLTDQATILFISTPIGHPKLR